jgi:hypothetical protein
MDIGAANLQNSTRGIWNDYSTRGNSVRTVKDNFPIVLEKQKTEKLSTLYNSLSASYPGIKYHILDTSKINQSFWERNDFPFEKFFEDNVYDSILEWKPTSQEPSMLDSSVQTRLNAVSGKMAVIVPPALEEKINNDPELAQNIMNKISKLTAEQDTVPSTIDSFNITLDEEGNISHYRFSGGGGELILPSNKELQEIKEKKKEETEQQEQYKRLVIKRELQKEQLEKVERDKIYRENIQEAIRLYEQNQI